MVDDDPPGSGSAHVRRTAPRLWRPGGHARRLDGLTLDAVVEQLAPIAALAAGELLALARRRLVPGEALPAPAVAERIVRMSAEELQDLGRRLQERLAPEAVQA